MIRALSDIVFVKPFPKEEQEGSIHVPSAAQKESTRGVVAAVGPGKKLKNGKLLKPLCVVGDVVHFNEHMHEKAAHGGVEYAVMHDSDVLLIEA